ncbi:MAG: LOG family protein [Candidatus Omnitrophica bacterium]|nr:LOG family protein [Candidatus Omnitrophota bacterium]
MKSKIIVVFGSGTAKENSPVWKEAYQTGFLLAQAGFTIVNGGYDGTMLASAKGAKEAHGKTIGVTTDEYADQGAQKNQFIDEEIRMPTWRERLFKLMDLGDGFMVLDGGTGTLVELATVWEMAAKGFHHKPIAILGRHMKSVVCALKSNSEVIVPQKLKLVSTPKAAIRYLSRHLDHG